MNYQKLYKKYKCKYKNLLAGTHIHKLTRSKSNPDITNIKPPLRRQKSLPIKLYQPPNYDFRDSNDELDSDDELYQEARDKDENEWQQVDIDHPVDPLVHRRKRGISSQLGDSDYLDIHPNVNYWDPIHGSRTIHRQSKERNF